MMINARIRSANNFNKYRNKLIRWFNLIELHHDMMQIARIKCEKQWQTINTKISKKNHKIQLLHFPCNFPMPNHRQNHTENKTQKTKKHKVTTPPILVHLQRSNSTTTTQNNVFFFNLFSLHFLVYEPHIDVSDVNY